MKPAVAFVVGGLAGMVLARLLIKSPSCCQRVAGGVRDRVGESLGGTAQSIGDVLGLWEYTPGLLDFFGVS